jgi:hypothetical protein
MCLIAATPVTAAEASATTMPSIKVRIGEKVFTARLEDNATATAFLAILPLTVKMRDLNDNEKVIDLSHKLPGEVANPRVIQVGDLMIWNSRSLVLFYKTFRPLTAMRGSGGSKIRLGWSKRLVPKP